MKRTSIGTLVLLAVIGALGGGFAETGLAVAGRPIILPPLTLSVALALIGAIVVWLAVPIRRLTKGKAKAPIDPFYATRVLMLAKACALSGALLTGLGAGIALYLLTRSVVPGVGSVGPAIATLVGAGLLLAAGLIAEHMCTILPSDDDDDESGKKTVRVRP
ncbi:DUF3180 domain-containing protein [Lacisediminihabitans sp.]|uniref:DUF3180 domain-containing protein n=1 Tax=Lacisediminihabitans sp. TaxID=2787631 RepID=UPI00374D434E